MKIDPIYLSALNSRKIYRRLKCRLEEGQSLNDEDLLQMIILPLTVEGLKNKKKMLRKTIELAKQIRGDEQRVRVLAGLLTFSDKFINAEDAEKIKEEIRMLKVTKLIFDEGVESGIAQGITQGITQGQQEKVVFQVRKKLGKNLKQNEIAEHLEENEEQVRRIIFLIQNHPDADDREICALLNEKEADK